MNTDKILKLHEIHARPPGNPSSRRRQKQKAAALSRSGLKQKMRNG
jgi:hypothetical protein